MQKEETIEFHQRLIKDVKKYIDENAWHQKLNAQTTCHRSGYSVAYMHRIFRKVTGESLSKHIKRKHFAHLKIALLNPEKTVSEIAIEHGYPTLCEFTRRFTNHCGIPPSEYRKINYIKTK